MGVDPNAIATIVGIDPQFKDLRGGAVRLLPQRVGLVGQGTTLATYALEPLAVLSAAAVGNVYGFGSPLHLAAKQLFPVNGDGIGLVPVTVYPLVDDGSGVAAEGSITPVGTQGAAASYVCRIGGTDSEPFVVAAGSVPGAPLSTIVAAAINANPSMPFIASINVADIDLTCKWAGVSGNPPQIQIIGIDDGITWGFTQPSGGLANPDVDDALALVGEDDWRTFVVNCMEYNDTSTLDKFQVWGDGRDAVLVKQPVMVITGNSTPSVTAGAISDGRKTDKINGYATSFGCPNLDCEIAARAVARIAVSANVNPPNGYGGLKLSGLIVGPDSAQENYGQRNAALLLGCSTSRVIDGIATLDDTVLFYHPVGENPPAFRYVVDKVKLANIIFNLRVIFEAADWIGAPLLADGDPTVNPAARHPSDAVAAANVMIAGLALEAILSDPATAQKLTTAVIDSGNPKRLNLSLTVQLSGNVFVISIDLAFGFYFGTRAIL